MSTQLHQSRQTCHDDQSAMIGHPQVVSSRQIVHTIHLKTSQQQLHRYFKATYFTSPGLLSLLCHRVSKVYRSKHQPTAGGTGAHT